MEQTIASVACIDDFVRNIQDSDQHFLFAHLILVIFFYFILSQFSRTVGMNVCENEAYLTI